MGWGSAIKKTAAPVVQAARAAAYELAKIDWDRLVTIDLETYYDSDYTLKKMSTSEYVRDPRFKAQMVGIKVGRKPTKIFTGAAIKRELTKINWATHALLAHNTAFDGLILSHHYGIVPSRYYDTLSMARGLHSNEIGGGLDDVSIFYGGEGKIQGALEPTLGVLNWDKALIANVSTYCARDVDECFRIFTEMVKSYPASEMELIHITIRMFCDPVLRVDIPRVQKEYERELAKRREILLTAVSDLDAYDYQDERGKWVSVLAKKDGRDELEGDERKIAVAKKVVGSNEKFAQLLLDAGVPEDAIPRKVSPAWMKLNKEEREEQIDKKWSYAFAKDDLEFVDLPERVWEIRPDLDPNNEGGVMRAVAIQEALRGLVDVRLAVKSTTNITRAERFLEAGKDGMKLPVGYSYYRAHCVPGTTEVLTRSGWVRLDAWQGGEIAQVHPDQRIEFLGATKFEGPVEDEWLQVSAPYIACDFTLGHTMPYFTQKSRRWETEQAGNLADRNAFDVPVGGRLENDGAITAEQMRVLVMVQADGSFETDTSIGRRMCVFVKKSRKIERARQLLTQAGVPFKEQTYSSHPDFVRFIVRCADYPEWLNPERKFFGPWLLDSTPDAREAFFDEIAHWDGYRNHAGCLCYSSSDQVNVDWVITLAHLSGRSASAYQAPAKGNRRANYTVSFRERAFAKIAKHQKRVVRAPKKTFCASTQTGFWLARSAGRIFVTGNTGRFGGNNKMNMQNLTRGGELRLSILAAKGHAMAVCDSGQIEARVNGWLWDQDDLLDAFRKSDAYDREVAGMPKEQRRPMREDERDAYCRFGDTVYGRPIWKSDTMERFIGKVCIAEGELVLTDRGLVPINLLSLEDRLWDGVEWVSHDGLVDQGIQEVITYDGLTATPDHEVFTEDGRIIPLGQAASEMAGLQTTGDQRRGVRFCDSAVVADTPRKRLSVRQGTMRTDGYYETDVAEQLAAWQNDIVSEERSSSDTACRSSGASVRRDFGAVYQSSEPAMGELRRQGHQSSVQQPHGVYPVGVGQPPAPGLQGRGDRSDGQQQPLHAWESEVGNTPAADEQPAQYREDLVAGRPDAAGRFPQPTQPRRNVAAGKAGDGGRADPGLRPAECGGQAQELALNRRKARVYDIANAGPRRRFTVSGKLVLNCVLGLGYQMGIDKFQMTLAKGALGGPRVNFPRDQCAFIVNAYRTANYKIAQGWKQCSAMIEDMAAGASGEHKCIRWGGDGEGNGWVALPNGMHLKYPQLRKARNDEKGFEEWSYQSGDARKKIYGGLLCLAGDTEVLTDSGWKALASVGRTDRVWDGVQWVGHDGVAYQGTKNVIDFGGVWMTPDHRVFSEGGWHEAQHTTYAQATSSFTRHFWAPPWFTDGGGSTWQRRTPDAMESSVRLRPDSDHLGDGIHEGQDKVVRVSHKADAQRADEDARHVQAAWPDSGAQGQQQELLARKLCVGDLQGAVQQQAQLYTVPDASRGADDLGSDGRQWTQPQHSVLPAEEQMAHGETAIPVYDIVNAGPNRRFTVRGADGRPFVVHNCENIVQALARIIVMEQMLMIDKKYRCVMTTHDEVVAHPRLRDAEKCYQFMYQCMITPLWWCPDIALSAEGGWAENYSK